MMDLKAIELVKGMVMYSSGYFPLWSVHYIVK